ncbi:hypothetical protein JQ557_24655 [Bradyrhizobium sp. U87765 SZCCT0131]|nr:MULTISPECIES: hypothetical protein [unclassified Bradyrhizobium]MBR1221213.1 hypothetical protein [Bradyrhizobium sp. U87765 SZCCT0131]MBR1259966.1 hypothetical protein [Bradyrhizobium sp. U87765 SZCCT0134]MBR1307785.1 hypothetical protein [Bradyrhizobium sp. U87765 SZCCT0110]MBR1321739.1 hypothetical protein [Bradyrhizobium sp. U87765 SZCCT0109]MBR1350051.1 hypothetical protein [Bradyrhizobium sp. U87765 SZCCT0048]
MRQFLILAAALACVAVTTAEAFAQRTCTTNCSSSPSSGRTCTRVCY